METAMIVLLSINTLLLIAICGSLTKLIKYLAVSEESSDEPVGVREDRGLMELGNYASYDWSTEPVPNHDGMTPRRKSKDALAERLMDDE